MSDHADVASGTLAASMRDLSARGLPREAIRQLLLLGLLLTARSAHATAGFAEFAWYFHDRPGQWIEWNHGDVCPPEAAHKNCVAIRQSRKSAGVAPMEPLIPYDESPRALYLTTLLALLPPVLAWVGLASLWGHWRQRANVPCGRSARSIASLCLMTSFALGWVPHALAVLFPASPSVDGWDVVIGLFLDILIVLAPVTLWWTYRALFPPPGRSQPKGGQRALLWLALLPSGLLAPLLLSGPPNLLIFLFPPMLLLNVSVSWLTVWVASTVTNAMSRKLAETKARGTSSAGR